MRLLLLLAVAATGSAAAQTTPFAKLSARLSEDAGFFHSDNLVSNETAYLQVLDTFRAMGLKGGAYLGVGPEQSFSYLAELEPEIAFIVDIRRDNLLLHLLFKVMFAASRNRLEYLGLLYGRAMPADLPMWTDLGLDALVDYLDQTPFDSTLHHRQQQTLIAAVDKLGFGLSDEDRAVMRRFHDEFAVNGLDLRYSTRMSPVRMSFPSIRQIYLATDLNGNQASYLGSEDRWRKVRDLERRDLVVPVVGNLAGPSAIRNIGAYLRETRRTVSLFYISNVEQYLFRDDLFPAFVANVRSLPTTDESLIVRSRYGRSAGFGRGGLSSQQVQRVSRFLELTAVPDATNYWMLLMDTVPVLPRAGGQRPPR
ncbi:MAG: hypothetical protein R2882_02960 [Gemmatimonadales bacterium]